MPTQAFLLLTNKHAVPIIGLYQELTTSTPGLGNTYLVYHQSSFHIPDVVQLANHYIFTNDILKELNYSPIASTLIPGSNHFPLLDFYQKHPSYDFYWLIEDDVRFSGDWRYFFDFFTNHAIQPHFLSSHIRTFQEQPEWHWWKTLRHIHYYIPPSLCIRSFNPIYRISNTALNCIHHMLTNKWQGHHEVLLPTLLYLEGFRIADFGGTGEFVQPGHEDQFYISGHCGKEGCLLTGTMRYRPAIQPSENLKNKLYHPIKI
jgi:hypothetical protein